MTESFYFLFLFSFSSMVSFDFLFASIQFVLCEYESFLINTMRKATEIVHIHIIFLNVHNTIATSRTVPKYIKERDRWMITITYVTNHTECLMFILIFRRYPFSRLTTTRYLVTSLFFYFGLNYNIRQAKKKIKNRNQMSMNSFINGKEICVK